MKMRMNRLIGAGLAAVLCAGSAIAKPLTGRQVVEQTCASCHQEGKNGAPRIGDFQEWGKRASQGFDKLAEHAMSGISGMPARGGRSELTDVEMGRAITYMATGGQSTDTNKALSKRKTIPSDVLVAKRCATCHGTGVDGAPRIKEFADWKPRLQNGIDALVASSIAGHNKMPSRAGMPGLSDEDMKGAILYMLVPAVATKK